MRGLSIERDDFGAAWSELVSNLLATGETVKPRDKFVKEHRNLTLTIHDARANILVNSVRNPSYRFMVAEWLWNWFGHEDVASIARYSKTIANFSDDGETFRGAYGPRIKKQWERVRETLRADPDTRQAVIQIFDATDLHGTTKDVPCTLALQFFCREGRLETTAYMRSSDVWLGLPYDFHCFSMMGNIMAAELNLEVGSMTFHLGSSHLYEVNEEKAVEAISYISDSLRSPRLLSPPPAHLDRALRNPSEWAQNTRGYSYPWMLYGAVLKAPNNKAALSILKDLI